MAKLADVNERIARTVTHGYHRMESSVVGCYKKLERNVVNGFTGVTDRCVKVLFAKEGETAEEAKARLSGKEVRR